MPNDLLQFNFDSRVYRKGNTGNRFLVPGSAAIISPVVARCLTRPIVCTKVVGEVGWDPPCSWFRVTVATVKWNRNVWNRNPTPKVPTRLVRWARVWTCPFVEPIVKIWKEIGLAGSWCGIWEVDPNSNCFLIGAVHGWKAPCVITFLNQLKVICRGTASSWIWYSATNGTSTLYPVPYTKEQWKL